MNWEIVGATGEWVGAMAVVASLVYLTSQIRLSNQQSQSAARYSFLDAYGQLHASLIESKQASSVYRRGLAGEALDPDGQWFIVRADLHSTLSTIGGREYWTRLGTVGTQPEFVEMVDRLLNSNNPSNDWFAPRKI